jgi:hypothetical protein
MTNYIAVHYNGFMPSFTYTDTVDAARNHLINLIVTRQASSTDAMAIVRAGDDQIIYYKTSNNTVASLSQQKPSRSNLLSSLYQFLGKRPYIKVANLISAVAADKIG